MKCEIVNSPGSGPVCPIAARRIRRRKKEADKYGLRSGYMWTGLGPRDDRQRGSRVGYPHVVLQLRHMFFGGGFFRKRPGQHELGLEHRAAGINQLTQGGRHPLMDAGSNPPLCAPDDVAGVVLIPAPVEVLGGGAELDDQVYRRYPPARPLRVFSATAERSRFRPCP
jgi:hypothetical protein